MESLSRKIVGSVIWTAAASWVAQLITFAVFVVLGRYLTPEDFGLATLAMLPPIILSVVVTTGIPDALIQRPEIERAHLDSAFWLLAGVGIALTALIFAFAGVIAAVFDQPLLRDIIRCASVNVAIEALAAVPTVIIKRELSFRMLALRTSTATAVSAALGIGMAVAGFGVWSLVCLQIAKTAVGVALLFLGTKWRPRTRYSHERCRELFAFARPIVAKSLLDLANNELPSLALGVALGPEAVGVYAFARRPFQILWDVFLTPLLALVMPTVSRIQGDPAKIDRFFDAALRMIAICAFPVFVGFAAVSPIAVPLIFGKQWQGAVGAIEILTPLAVLRTIEALCAYTILALGHSRLVFKLNITYALVAAIPIVAAARISVEAMAAASVVCNLMVLPFFLFFARRTAQIDLQRPLGIFPKLTALSLLMFASVRAAQVGAPTHAPQIAILGTAILIGMMVYAAGVTGVVRADLRTARDLFLKIRR